MKYIVDIDNTICLSVNSDYPNSKPIWCRIEHLNKLHELGNEIHYWTARGGGSGIDWTELTEQQLNDWGCKFDSVTMKKPSYDAWIDDKAYNADAYFGPTCSVFVNGTFDILHPGHVSMLKHARQYGRVIVGIDTDRRVKELKGSDRPINNEQDRKFMLESLGAVDQVFLFDTDEELRELVRKYGSKVMVKGADYKDKPIIGSEFCEQIIFYEVMDGYSTTGIIQSISDR